MKTKIERKRPNEYNVRIYILTHRDYPWQDPQKFEFFLPMYRWGKKPIPAIFVGWNQVEITRAEFATLLKKIRTENREKTEVAA